MLENRDYMRAPSYSPRQSATITLLIINAVVFILQLAFSQVFPVDKLFALSVEGLKAGYVWQLITFQFMHGGILHLLLNCWALYIFGMAVEETLGKRSFLVLYLTSGVFGGLLQLAGSLIWPSHLGGAVVGASAGVSGLIAAFATLHPERQLGLLLFYVIPVSMRARFFLLFCALLSIAGIVFPYGRVAHAAHLGGILMGIAYVKHIIHWQWSWLHFRRPRRQRQPREFAKVSGNKWSNMVKGMPPAEDVPTEEFISQEVDPILDKISQHGLHSLTERERKILDAAQKRISR
jgi:membrane associated rhomboid family serine protease